MNEYLELCLAAEEAGRLSQFRLSADKLIEATLKAPFKWSTFRWKVFHCYC